MKDKKILPIRLDSYAGETSALEAHLFEDKEEYGGKSVPDDCMWAAVYILDGKIDHSMTDYGYRSLKELRKAYRGEKIIGLRESVVLDEAREIVEDTVGVLLASGDVAIAFAEGELGLQEGRIKKAYQTIQKKARFG